MGSKCNVESRRQSGTGKKNWGGAEKRNKVFVSKSFTPGPGAYVASSAFGHYVSSKMDQSTRTNQGTRPGVFNSPRA